MEYDNKRTEETGRYIEPLFRFHTKRAEKFTFVPQTTAEVQRECAYMRARACVRICAHSGLVNEHKIGSDRS